MKRIAVILTVLTLSLFVAAQAGQQSPPAGAPPAPQGKRPPQLKTKPEQEAYNAAAALTDPAAQEKAADDFATKFPDSEVRVLLYKSAMRNYQNTNNAERTEAMGRKVIGLDGDDPEALVAVSEVIAERTHDTDLDKDQRFDEAVKMSQRATQTVDTDITVPAGAPQDRVDAYKAGLRSQAYSIIGTVQFKQEHYKDAQDSLQKSIDAYPQDPDPIVVLRLALALDKQEKYPDAQKVAERAVELTTNNPRVGDQVKNMAKQELTRLQQLNRVATPAPPATQPPKN